MALTVELEPQANWTVVLDGVIGGQLEGVPMLAGQPIAATTVHGITDNLIRPMTTQTKGNCNTL